jgi:hypothetical protein
MDIDYMTAGLDLDELIIEKVIGWDAVKKILDPKPMFSKFSPSTDIADAWMVVEKFYSLNLHRYLDGKEFTAYLVTERENKNIDGYGVADTAPLAICRAALKATMRVNGTE